MAKVFLSAGHGGSDPGAVAYGLLEKIINLNTMLACNEVLVRHGVETVLSRTKDENDPTYQECREANAAGVDLAVSFHANAGRGDGWEGFHFSTNADGKRLVMIAEKYIKELGQNSRGVKVGDHLYFIKNTNMTAVLFESFFLDNDKDNDIGDTVAEQKAFGVQYAKAILEYFGIAYKDNTVKPTVKTINELAKEVIAGKWGNGADRKARLTEAGYDYEAVQNEVDEMLTGKTADIKPIEPKPVEPKPEPKPKKTIDELAKEVLAGKWGNGSARKKALTEAGYNYDAVQDKVDELLSGTTKETKKSIDEIAREVIAGKWGNGADRRDRLTKAGYDYSAVQKRVNELM